VKINNAAAAVVERDGLSSDGAFSIQFNAKMAKILSDGLYSDKIGSIIRELSCNAVDSHVEAGYADRPIEIHLPTQLEPWFHVRDFGVGLDHQQVIGIYTVYGASTKTNSNDFIGQLGLGSKSPFSYVDAFDVTARKDGIERQYSMYKNEQGMPSVALLGEQPTAEPNGITVQMPVKQEDISRFSERAANVFQWFSVKPVFTGRDIKIPPVEAFQEGTAWKIRKYDNNYYSRVEKRPVALMGRVAYPLDHTSITGLTKAQEVLLGMPIILEFAIGELEVAASREALGYDPRTQANIRARLTHMIDEMSVVFERKIAAAKTEWEARKIFNSIFGAESGYRYQLEAIYSNRGLTWNGKLIKEGHVSFKTETFWDKNFTPKLWTINGSYKTCRRKEYHDEYSVRCSDDAVFVFDDLDKGTNSRVSYYHEQTGRCKEIYVFGPSDFKTVSEIVDALGNPGYVMSSTLPKRPSAAREKVKAMRYNGTGDTSKSWTPVDVDIDEGGFYVNIDRWDVQYNGQPTNNLSTVFAAAKALGIIKADDEVYAPRGHFKAKMIENEDWLEFFDYVKEKMQGKMNPTVLQAVADSIHFRTETSKIPDKLVWETDWKLSDTHGVFARFVDGVRKLSDINQKSTAHHTLIELARCYGDNHNLPQPSFDVAAAWEDVKLTYPMMEYGYHHNRYNTYHGYDKSFVRKLEKYVDMVDEVNAAKARVAAAKDKQLKVA